MLTNTILQTHRLTFSPFTPVDAPFMLKLMNCPTWIEFIGKFDIKSLEETERFIENSIASKYEQNGFGLWKVTLSSSGEPIGLCGLGDKPELPYPDLGVALLPEFEGKGFGMEAIQATLDYAWNVLKLDNLCAVVRPNNDRMAKISNALGFELQGITLLSFYGETLLYEINNPMLETMEYV